MSASTLNAATRHLRRPGQDELVGGQQALLLQRLGRETDRPAPLADVDRAVVHVEVERRADRQVVREAIYERAFARLARRSWRLGLFREVAAAAQHDAFREAQGDVYVGCGGGAVIVQFDHDRRAEAETLEPRL